MAWTKITHRYDDGTQTEFECGTEAPAYPDELRELVRETLHMYREVVGEGDSPDVLHDDGTADG